MSQAEGDPCRLSDFQQFFDIVLQASSDVGNALALTPFDPNLAKNTARVFIFWLLLCKLFPTIECRHHFDSASVGYRS